MREIDAPQSTDSAPGVAVSVDGSPDSSRQFEVKKETGKRIRRSRGVVKRLIVPAAVMMATLVGPEAIDMGREQQRLGVVADIDQAKEKSDSKVLSRAQLNALKKFYPKENGGYDYEAAEEMMHDMVIRTKGIDWQLPVSNFMNAEDAKVSEDGMTVKLNGTPHSFARFLDHNGDLYIIVSRPVIEDNILSKDRVHAAAPMLVGGARFEEGVSQNELTEKAYEDVRGRLQAAKEELEQCEEEYVPRDCAIELK